MAEISEMLIRIAFQLDPAGAEDAIDKLRGIKKEVKETGDEVKRGGTSWKTMGREISMATRPMMVGGMAIAHLGMALGQTNVLSQAAAGQLVQLGSSLAAGAGAARLASSMLASYGTITKDAGEAVAETGRESAEAAGGVAALGNASVVAMGAVAAFAVAIAAITFLMGEQSKATKILKGDFENLETLVVKTSEGAYGYAGSAESVNAAIYKWYGNQKLMNEATKNFKDKLAETFPEIKDYVAYTNKLDGWTKKLSWDMQGLAKATDHLNSLNENKSKWTSDQQKWNDAIEDSVDLTERLEDGTRGLKSAKLDLEDAIASGAEADKKWELAQAMHKTGALSEKGLEAARREHERSQLSIEGARDAVSDQVTENDKNKKSLDDAKKVQTDMTTAYGSMVALTTQIATNESQIAYWKGEQTKYTKDIETDKTNIEGINLAIDTITKNSPQLIENYKNFAFHTVTAAEAWMKMVNNPIPNPGGYLTSEEGGEQYGPVPAAGGGMPYVPRDGLMRVHTGEAIIPANQNNYADNISIKNLSLSRGYGMDMFMKDRDRAIRIKRKMLGYT
jgi:hypothetical protein